MDVTVPAVPPLVTIPNVELMHAGTWNISTGEATFEADDFYSAVAALECPAVHRPVLKLGHNEPDPEPGQKFRWDGAPAVGWVGNLAVAESGRTLVGDYTEMPNWLGKVLPSAYPNRSIEGWFDYRCQLNHVHPFVLTAVALLGVTPPGIGTLQSLHDVAALYGVAASDSPAPVGTPVRIHAAREDRVPNPNPNQVAAGVTTEDVRRAFYSSEFGKSWDIWICEMQLDPMQLIVTDDTTGKLSRVPVTVGDGDGEDAVSFGDPVPVVVRYEDAGAVAASAGPAPVRYASRQESRPGERPRASEPEQPEQPELPDPEQDEPEEDAPAPETPSTPAVEDPSPNNTEGAGMSLDPAKIREALGLAPEASDEEVSTALAAAGLSTQPPAEPDPTPQPEEEGESEPEREEPAAPATPAPSTGTVTIDEATLADLRAKAEQGVAARARQLIEDRDRTIKAAIDEGKIPPARKAHWEQAWKADPEGARQTLASLAPGLVPVADQGVPGPAEEAAPDFSDVDRLFSRPVPTRQGA